MEHKTWESRTNMHITSLFCLKLAIDGTIIYVFGYHLPQPSCNSLWQKLLLQNLSPGMSSNSSFFPFTHSPSRHTREQMHRHISAWAHIPARSSSAPQRSLANSPTAVKPDPSVRTLTVSSSTFTAAVVKVDAPILRDLFTAGGSHALSEQRAPPCFSASLKQPWHSNGNCFVTL